jgi:crotonobetainyl-CoA:carnitine CoA-transferase CaiB-like acyl-CoA transferase
MSALLDGIKIIDFTQVISGPYATYMLAQQGADVIKLELPGDGDQARGMMLPSGDFADAGHSAMFLAFNSGKRSLALNLKSPAANEILTRLIKDADVIIENFKAGAMERLGFGYEWAREIKQNIIYCSISGFGQSGPRAGAAAYDPVIQANSGMMQLTGHEGITGPTKVGFWVCDMSTGMTAAFAISAALSKLHRDGEGSYIDISMLDVAASLISPMVTNFLNFGVQPSLMGNGSPAGSTVSTVYETGEGLLQVAAATQGQFEAQAKAMNRQDLIEDPRFSSRQDRILHAAELRQELLVTFSEADAKTWEARLSAVGVPAGVVHSIEEMVKDPQIVERGLVREQQAPTGLNGYVQTIGAPFKVNGENGLSAAAPNLGEHTEEILMGLGYSSEDISSLKVQGAIS